MSSPEETRAVRSIGRSATNGSRSVCSVVVLLGIGIYAYNAFFATSTPAPQPAPVTPRTVEHDRNQRHGRECGARQQRRARQRGANTGHIRRAGCGCDEDGEHVQQSGPDAGRVGDAAHGEPGVLGLRAQHLLGHIVCESPKLPEKLPPARPVTTAPVAPVSTGPPPPPPINLKYFGTELTADGRKQAFLLSGEDVYMASQGDIVARKYKIVNIGATSIQVEDLSNQNTQTLPLQTN